ncbi:MAG: lipopolysaccharide biosynthesis protein [Terriglobales bacterium]
MKVKQDLRDLMCVAVPKGLSGVLQIAINFALLRYLGPSEFGLLSVCVTAIILSDAIISPPVDLGVLRLAPLDELEDPRASVRLQKAALVFKLTALAALAVPIVFLPGLFSHLLFRQPGEARLLYLTVLGIVGLGLLRSTQTHFQVSGRFASFGVVDLGNSMLKYGGIALLLAYSAASPETILAFHATVPLAVTAIVLLLLARPLLFSKMRFVDVKRLWRVVKWYVATTALGSLVSRIDVFIVSNMLGVAAAGILGAAYTFALVPQLLGMYMSVVFSPRIIRLWNQGTLAPVYYRYQRFLVALAVLFYAVAWVGFPPLARWFLPPSYAATTGVFLALLPAMLCSLINFPWSIPFLLFLRPRFLLTLDCIGFPVLLLLYWRVIPSHGVLGAAVLTSIYSIVKTLVMQGAAIRILKAGPGSGTTESAPASFPEWVK